MPGLLEYALRADAPQMGLLGRLGAFLAERKDFANNRMQQLLESEWRPWEWDYDTRAAEMRGLLAGQAGGGPVPDWTQAIGDALGAGVIPGSAGILRYVRPPAWSRNLDPVPVGENPTRSELAKLFRMAGERQPLRALESVDDAMPVYVWPFDRALHEDIAHALHLDPAMYPPSGKGILVPESFSF